jgi:protein-tyrosine phosphatase
MMMTLYRRIAFDFRVAFRALFIQLERSDLPLVFNCTAGKDRTGVAAALILSSLGVSREQVIQDYLLSELCFTQSCEIILKGNLAGLFTGVEREVWEPVMRVDKSYIEATFEEIIRVNGSVDGYLTNELGISQSTRDRIARNLLE